jgi:hypothetical protein
LTYKSGRTNEETSPGVKSLLDRVYAQKIDRNELLNTLELFGFPGFMSQDIRLLLLMLLLGYYRVPTRHAPNPNPNRLGVWV